MIFEDKYEVQNMTVFSTAHITKNDGNKLMQNEGERVCWYNFDYGHFILLRSDMTKKAIIADGFSEAFANVYLTARAMGSTCMTLDCDGPIYEQHEVFEWQIFN